MDHNPEFQVPKSEPENDTPQPTRHMQESKNGNTSRLIRPVLVLASIVVLAFLYPRFTDTPSTPTMVFDQPSPPYYVNRLTPKHKIKYFVNPKDIELYGNYKLSQLDEIAEDNFLRFWDGKCEQEIATRFRRMKKAQGWLFNDDRKMAEAKAYPAPSCERLAALGYTRQ